MMGAIERILLLRTMAIAIQLCAVIGFFAVMPQDITIFPLLTIIAFETAFHLFSWRWYRHHQASSFAVAAQAIADIVFLTLLMAYSGGATNAFVSLLLMPIVIGAVSLPTRMLAFVSLCAVIAYSALLMSLPTHQHHMDMTNHFIGMWVNFLLSVIVVTLVVGTMSKMITNRERAIAKQREEQLKSEQLISLGVASAQVTHQLATPLANLQLLFEEIHEEFPNEEAVKAMESPLEICRNELNHFRELATAIRENKTIEISPLMLLKDIKTACNLQYPELELVTHITNDDFNAMLIQSDAMLLPAICNLLQNAVKSNQQSGVNQVELGLTATTSHVTINIRDFGGGIEASRSLGASLVESDKGLGMALMLSNSTFERLNGELVLSNHRELGAVASVKLPLVKGR
ncbi:MAG: hypothetical protein BM565_03425 [Gammaproteobacteria bacterium MedPE]|nr:MAG: hypothetical protein BM565_03425 [Gammaproteobacteria bacterium MedPE]